MQETKETEEKNKDGITIQELTEKIRQMDQEEFIVTVSLEGGLAGMAENEMNKGLSQVSIRLVQESPLLSDESINTPEQAVKSIGRMVRRNGSGNWFVF